MASLMLDYVWLIQCEKCWAGSAPRLHMRWTDLRFYSLSAQTIIWPQNKGCIERWHCSFLNSPRRYLKTWFLTALLSIQLSAKLTGLSISHFQTPGGKELRAHFCQNQFFFFLSFSTLLVQLGHPDVWHIAVCYWTRSMYG